MWKIKKSLKSLWNPPGSFRYNKENEIRINFGDLSIDYFHDVDDDHDEIRNYVFVQTDFKCKTLIDQNVDLLGI